MISKTEKRAYWVQLGIYVTIAVIGMFIKDDGCQCECKRRY